MRHPSGPVRLWGQAGDVLSLQKSWGEKWVLEGWGRRCGSLGENRGCSLQPEAGM